MQYFLKYSRVRKFKIGDRISILDSNCYISESFNIFKIRLFSTNAYFVCDNHVQLTQLFTTSALLAQSRIRCFMPL